MADLTALTGWSMPHTRSGSRVMLDVVYNHLGPEGNYLGEFGPYFSDVHRTPWGAAVNLDGPDSSEVRRFLVENACYWLADHHIDGLRLDAVHALVDDSAEHFLVELSRRGRRARRAPRPAPAPGRRERDQRPHAHDVARPRTVSG